MRRGLIVSIAAMVMLSMAVPAGAKGKPDKPDRPPEGEGKTCAALVANGAVWDLGEYSDGLYTAFISNSDEHGGICIDLLPEHRVDGEWTVSWIIEIPPDATLRGLLMRFQKGLGFSGTIYEENEVRYPQDATWVTDTDDWAATPEVDGTEPFVFVAMRDIKRAKGNWRIAFTITPPQI